MIETARLMMVGFGNVGKAFARLLLDKEAELLEQYQLRLAVTGICTRSHGAAIDPRGLDLRSVLETLQASGSLGSLDRAGFSGNALDFIRACEERCCWIPRPLIPNRDSPLSLTWKPAYVKACTPSRPTRAR